MEKIIFSRESGYSKSSFSCVKHENLIWNLKYASFLKESISEIPSDLIEIGRTLNSGYNPQTETKYCIESFPEGKFDTVTFYESHWSRDQRGEGTELFRYTPTQGGIPCPLIEDLLSELLIEHLRLRSED